GLLRLLTTPARMAGFGFGMLTSSTAMMFAVLQRITGFEVLTDLSDYVTSFTGMHAGFRDRAGAVEERLRSRRTSFALVASPGADTVDEAIFLYRKLQAAGMHFGGFIVNRLADSALKSAEATEEWRAIQQSPQVLTDDPVTARRLVDNF